MNEMKVVELEMSSDEREEMWSGAGFGDFSVSIVIPTSAVNEEPDKARVRFVGGKQDGAVVLG